MITDLHSHTSGISACCRADAEKILKIADNAHIGALVLTNHYTSNYFSVGDSKAFARRYFEEFKKTERLGDEIGVKVFFGIEVTAEVNDFAHLLVYGVDERFVLDNSDMYSYPQEKLYGVVKDYGGVLVWAHPFRGGYNGKINLKYLDGLEVNCHPKYGSTYIKDVAALAKQNGLFVTCGGDYHHDTAYRPHCGVYTDKPFQSIHEIVDHLRDSQSIKLVVQEPGADNSFEFVFNK